MTVEDKGPGVARAERTNVFRMFNRSGTTGGTGVGLSIAKAFVEAHGQEIWVEDAPTGGRSLLLHLATGARHRGRGLNGDGPRRR